MGAKSKKHSKVEFETVSCYSCNQEWCIMYGQWGAFNKCRDHPENKKVAKQFKNELLKGEN